MSDAAARERALALARARLENDDPRDVGTEATLARALVACEERVQRERDARHAVERQLAEDVVARRTNLEAQVVSEKARADDAEERERQLREALRLLLLSQGCLTSDGQPEIREELSARFDITFDQADTIIAALAARSDTDTDGGTA